MSASLHYSNCKKGTGGYILHCFDVYNEGHRIYPYDEVCWGDHKITYRSEVIANFEMVDGKPIFKFKGPEAKRLEKAQRLYGEFVDWRFIIPNIRWYIQDIRDKFSFREFQNVKFSWDKDLPIQPSLLKKVEDIVMGCLHFESDKAFAATQLENFLKLAFHGYSANDDSY